MSEKFRYLSLKPSWTPRGAYDIPFLFKDETESLVDSLCQSLQNDRHDLQTQAHEEFLEIDILKDSALQTTYSLVLYEEILANLYNDDLAWVYEEGQGYRGLVHNSQFSLLQMMIIDSMRIRMEVWRMHKDPRLSTVPSEPRDSGLLFHPARIVSGEYTTISPQPGLRQASASLERIEGLLEEQSHRPSRAKRRTKRSEEEPAEETPEPTSTLRQLVDSLEGRTSGGPLFSSFWMAPPPLAPSDLHTLESLSSGESALLLDLFLDLYQSEMLFLSLYFLIKRLLDLWSRSADEPLEPALHRSSERAFVSDILDDLSEELAESFSARFLSVEGISLGGSRLYDGLGQISSKGTGDSDPVINIIGILEDQLDLIRDSCLALERTRVSILYGREHPSYVGDGFLSSYISLFYKVQQAELSFDSLIALANPIGAMALPKDEERITSFLEGLCDRLPSESQRHNIREPELRKGYKDTTPSAQRLFEELGTAPTREHLGTEGLLESVRDGGESHLFSIIERSWHDTSRETSTES